MGRSLKSRLIGLAIGAAMTAGVAGSAAAAAPIRITIGWVPPDISGVFKTATNFFEKSAQDADAHGFDITVLTRSPTSHTDFAAQNSIIEDLIQQHVDVIAVSPSEVETVKPALIEARQANIPVIVVDLLEPISGVDVNAFIGFDNAQGAEVSAYAIANYFGGPGVLGIGPKVDVKPGEYLDLAFWQKIYSGVSAADKAKIKARGAIIEGIAGGFYSSERLKGFREVMKQFPGIQIVGAPCAADWNREKGTGCAEDILQSNPNLDFIWSASNEMGLGAMLAAQSAGRLRTVAMPVTTGGKTVAMFMNDVTPESVDHIAKGKIIAETTHGFADWGWFGTKFAVQLACGEPTAKLYDIRPRTVYQVNAHEFYPNPKLPPIDWDSIRAACKKQPA